MQEQEIGKIKHFYSNIGVGIIELKDTLKIGEEIHIKGHTTDVQQKIDSMQIEHKQVQEAKSGDLVGIKVSEHVRPNDVVYKIIL